jgi:hypothetical protein
MPNVTSRFTLPFFVLGGAAIGLAVGVKMFGDDGLRRLERSHELDRANNIEGQKFMTH